MSAPAAGPAPYRVVYSERVRQRLLALADVARERGDGEADLAALKEFHRRLCLYPPFGEPLIDLTQEAGQVWLGTVRPLAMRYGVFDERRIVMITEVLPVLLPRSAPEESARGPVRAPLPERRAVLPYLDWERLAEDYDVMDCRAECHQSNESHNSRIIWWNLLGIG